MHAPDADPALVIITGVLEPATVNAVFVKGKPAPIHDNLNGCPFSVLNSSPKKITSPELGPTAIVHSPGLPGISRARGKLDQVSVAVRLGPQEYTSPRVAGNLIIIKLKDSIAETPLGVGVYEVTPLAAGTDRRPVISYLLYLRDAGAQSHEGIGRIPTGEVLEKRPVIMRIHRDGTVTERVDNDIIYTFPAVCRPVNCPQSEPAGRPLGILEITQQPVVFKDGDPVALGDHLVMPPLPVVDPLGLPVVDRQTRPAPLTPVGLPFHRPALTICRIDGNKIPGRGILGPDKETTVAGPLFHPVIELDDGVPEPLTGKEMHVVGIRSRAEGGIVSVHCHHGFPPARVVHKGVGVVPIGKVLDEYRRKTIGRIRRRAQAARNHIIEITNRGAGAPGIIRLGFRDNVGRIGSGTKWIIPLTDLESVEKNVHVGIP